eukprot:2246062-Amphidinium_carterae.1
MGHLIPFKCLVVVVAGLHVVVDLVMCEVIRRFKYRYHGRLSKFSLTGRVCDLEFKIQICPERM